MALVGAGLRGAALTPPFTSPPCVCAGSSRVSLVGPLKAGPGEHQRRTSNRERCRDMLFAFVRDASTLMGGGGPLGGHAALGGLAQVRAGHITGHPWRRTLHTSYTAIHTFPLYVTHVTPWARAPLLFRSMSSRDHDFLPFSLRTSGAACPRHAPPRQARGGRPTENGGHHTRQAARAAWRPWLLCDGSAAVGQ